MRQSGYWRLVWLKEVGVVSTLGITSSDDGTPSRRVLLLLKCRVHSIKTLLRILNEHWKFSVGVTHTFGGEEKVAGIALDNAQNSWRWEAGAVFNLTPAYQVVAVYQRDLKVENGFRLDHGLNLRFLYAF